MMDSDTLASCYPGNQLSISRMNQSKARTNNPISLQLIQNAALFLKEYGDQP